MKMTYEIPIAWVEINNPVLKWREKYITTASNYADAILYAASYISREHSHKGIYGVIDEFNVRVL